MRRIHHGPWLLTQCHLLNVVYDADDLDVQSAATNRGADGDLTVPKFLDGGPADDEDKR